MLAVDTSTWIAFFEKETGADIEQLRILMNDDVIFLPPAVFVELMSFPQLDMMVKKSIQKFSLLEIDKNYWKRVANLRFLVLSKGFKAKLGDTMVAQSCLDYDLPLITRDTDFFAFHKIAGLQLYNSTVH